jgi:hypothetical protein
LYCPSSMSLSLFPPPLPLFFIHQPFKILPFLRLAQKLNDYHRTFSDPSNWEYILLMCTFEKHLMSDYCAVPLGAHSWLVPYQQITLHPASIYWVPTICQLSGKQ